MKQDQKPGDKKVIPKKRDWLSLLLSYDARYGKNRKSHEN